MPTDTLFDITVEGLPTPSPYKNVGNPDYTIIKEFHQLLTTNAASVNSNLGGDNDSYLGLILPPKKYARVSGTTFIRLPDP